MKTKPPITEREFLAQVIALAHLRGWLCMHQRPARTSLGGWRTAVQGDGRGWPDLFLARGPRAIAAELKTERGKTTPEQEIWLEAMAAAGIEAYTWRPSDWDEILETLE